MALYNAATMFGRARMPEFQANCLASLVRMHPKNVQNHTLLFRAFLAAGMENEARRQAELTYAIYPEHPAALRNLAHAYRLAGDLELAEDVLGRAIDAAPEDSSLCLELADLLVDAGDYQRARELISDTAVSEEMRTQANSIAAFAAALEGEWTPALELWNDVRHVGPVPAIRLLCSAALAQAGRADDAAAALTADRDGEPLATVSETPAMLAEALRGWKAPGPLLEGASDLGRALADNRTALVDYALGAACLRAGYFTAGLTVLQELDASLGGHPGLAAPILRALARARVADARIGAGEAIVDRYPEVSAAWQAFASLCEMEGDPARQQLALEKAVETGPDQFPAWYALAVYRTEREDFQQAEEAFRRLLELAPDHPAVQNNLAYCILQTGGDVNEALDFARAAVDKLGANAHAVHTLGLAQLRAGEHEEARKHLAVALEMRPGDPTLLLDYGRALIALGRDDEGKLHVRSAILYADQMGLDFPRRAEAEQVLANGPAA